MIIREVAEKDIPQIIHLGGRMHEESQYSTLEYAPEKVASMCYQIINSENMIGLVAVENDEIHGMFYAQIAEYLYGRDLIASDCLLYISPQHRGSRILLNIVDEYENWAFMNHAVKVFLTQTSGIDVDKVSDLYKRLGYNHVGGIFTKDMP